MPGEAACDFKEDSSGLETPLGFRDTLDQWHTANHRKRTALSQLDGDPTQRDSQTTQVATELATPFVDGATPVFIAAALSEEDVELQHEENSVDEEETQIRMSGSERREEALLSKKNMEETVPLPAVSSASRFGSDAAMGKIDADVDSDMSDDMLEQNDTVAGLSSIVALFLPRDEEPQAEKTRIYKPRTYLRETPVNSTRNEFDSSDGETEIESEPKEESPAKNGVETLMKEPLSRRKVLLRQSATKKSPKPKLKVQSSERDDKTSFVPTKRTRIDKCEAGLDQSSLDKLAERKVDNKSIQHKRKRGQTRQNCKDTSSQFDTVGEPPTSSNVRERVASFRSAIDNTIAGSQADRKSIRIILTGLEPTGEILKKIKLIDSASYENNIENATHVIVPQNKLKRTVKLLCGISCCVHILDERWLDQSARTGVAVDEKTYCLRDEVAEKKWQFDLERTMYGVSLDQRQHLFAGVSVFITNHKSVLPPAKELVKIVECAGGKASLKGKAKPNDVVITSEAALAVATVRKQLVNANSERIYTPELLLSSILKQQIEFNKFQLQLV